MKLLSIQGRKGRRGRGRASVFCRSGLGLLLGGVLANAQDVVEQGATIAARCYQSDQGYGDTVVEATMTLRNPRGRTSTRIMIVRTLEIRDDQIGDKSLMEFRDPPDIEGTALLSHTRLLEPDDQWLYLPALERVKRIASVNKSGPFVASEFAFEDFTALEFEKYRYRYLREEQIADMACDVIEQVPRYQHSGYARQVCWIDQQVHQVRKVVFYDRRDKLLKTLEVSDYRLYLDRFWRAHRWMMVNHQSGKSTALVYGPYAIQTGLSDRDFDKSALLRLR